jgi:hypothetical protein
MKKGNADILTMVVALVAGIVLFSVLDMLIADTNNPASVVNETVGTANASGYLSATLDYPLIVDMGLVYCNSTATTNYTVTDFTGAIVVDGADCASAAVLASYTYDDGTYMSGSLSRLILTYLVPIGMLGLLGFIVFRRL